MLKIMVLVNPYDVIPGVFEIHTTEDATGTAGVGVGGAGGGANGSGCVGGDTVDVDSGPDSKD